MHYEKRFKVAAKAYVNDRLCLTTPVCMQFIPVTLSHSHLHIATFSQQAERGIHTAMLWYIETKPSKHERQARTALGNHIDRKYFSKVVPAH